MSESEQSKKFGVAPPSPARSGRALEDLMLSPGGRKMIRSHEDLDKMAPEDRPEKWVRLEWTEFKELDEVPEGRALPYTQEEYCKGITFLKELGRGAYGGVWLAKQNRPGLEDRTLAIKVVYYENHSGETPDVAARDMINEFELIKRIDHPNLVRMEKMYYIYERQTRYPFLRVLYAMELCMGDLEDYLKKLRRPMNDDEARNCMWQLALGLRCLHQHNVVHRDININNVFYIVRSGKITSKLGDFGLAMSVEDDSPFKNLDLQNMATVFLRLKLDLKRCRDFLDDVDAQKTISSISSKYRNFVSALFTDLLVGMATSDWDQMYDIDQVTGHQWFREVVVPAKPKWAEEWAEE